ncbi:unnamed protein product [Rotaria sordida]|uniref:Uncharacterized protein n=1 Tax=Rotaria sordida TaxID=392033 RepID=A0A815VYK5_9BILA|nr:unnamed protein product [Rotaria sordida]CAF3976618.1 unnamed protein product [Rotaria sordida]
MEQLNNSVYNELHQILILLPTRREREQQDTPRDILQKQDYNKKEIRVYFKYESGPQLRFKHEIHELWKKFYVYKGSPIHDVTLKISTRTNKSLNELLIKKKTTKIMVS